MMLEILDVQTNIAETELQIKKELDDLGLSFLDGPNGFGVFEQGNLVGSFYLDDDEQWYMNKEMYKYLGAKQCL